MDLDNSFGYKMNHFYRGQAVIFNQVKFNDGSPTRKGSQLDAKRLKQVLEEMRFHVALYTDLLHKDIKKKINDLAKQDHSDSDCVLVAVLSHGRKSDGFPMAKDEAYDPTELWQPFVPDRCPSLAGKPKLFFFQTCRGEKIDNGVPLDSDEYESDAGYQTALMADFFMAYSSAKGFVSFRKEDVGSLFIQALCDVLEKYPCQELQQIMIRVHKQVTDITLKDNKKQVPQTVHTLTRDLYFKRDPSYGFENMNNGVGLNRNESTSNMDVDSTVGNQGMQLALRSSITGKKSRNKLSALPNDNVTRKRPCLDKYDTFAEHVAVELRELTPKMYTNAKEAINKVLASAARKKLPAEGRILPPEKKTRKLMGRGSRRGRPGLSRPSTTSVLSVEAAPAVPE